MIYADNAATTKLAPEVFEEMKEYLLESYGNPSQPYNFSRKVKRAIQEARNTIADCIGADFEEILFTSCGTESDNWAVNSGMGGHGSIITSSIEHHAILESCKAAEKSGRTVKFMPVDGLGLIDLSWLKDNISDTDSLVSVMYANNEIGTIQPIDEIASIAHRYGCLFHTDAVQAVGHITINVHKSKIDLLSASAHKFNGPKGVGFLYAKRGLSIDPYINGGGQEFGMRAGTENVASIVGMAKALDTNCKEMEHNKKHLLSLEKELLKGLRQAGIDFMRNGSDHHIPGNVSLSFNGIDGEMLLHRLDLMGICVSTGSACDSQRTQLSHVLRAIDIPEEYAFGTIRISLGKYNTFEDVITIVKAIKKILG